ncbi:MAG TPA: FHA domain-containing protein [Vicinamibacterales bacterium]|nr:FHA domain-containing protein [Vicinamibacterales bacterium]
MKLRFRDFTLDSDRRQLLAGGGEVHLSVKAFDLLCALLEHRPNVVPKSELQARLWPDTHVVDANLAVLIGEIRRALSDPASEPRLIRTVHRIGYAFSVAAREVDRRSDPDQASRFWLSVDGRAVMLPEGATVIGRDPRSDIWLDLEGVSRRHARIRVTRDTDEAVLEDLASTNGTFIGRTRITTPRPLKDGDVIRIGSASLPFRVWSEHESSKTKRIRK